MKTAKIERQEPFFARFLESQLTEQDKVKGGAKTDKFPSDDDIIE